MQAARSEPEQRRSRGWVAALGRWIKRRATVPASVPPPARSARTEIAQPDPRIPLLLEEWKEIRASLRAAEARAVVRLAIFLALEVLLGSAYLNLRTASGPLWDVARWVLPGCAFAASLLFLVWEWACQSDERALVRRGRQVETVVQILMPGPGSARALALHSEVLPEQNRGLRSGAWARTALYALVVLLSLAALIGATAGWPGRPQASARTMESDHGLVVKRTGCTPARLFGLTTTVPAILSCQPCLRESSPTQIRPRHSGIVET